MNLQEQINRIKSIMITENEHSIKDVFKDVIDTTFPELNNLKIERLSNTRNIYLSDENDRDLFHCYPLYDEPGKPSGLFAMTDIDGIITDTLHSLFGGNYENLLLDFLNQKYDLNIDYILS